MNITYTICLAFVMALIGFIFGGKAMKKTMTNHMQEYQIRLELDSAYIYRNGLLVGSCEHGSDGIDSVILKDNL